MISALNKELPIEVWGKVHEPPKNLSVKPSVWGYEMHRVLASSQISLNVHTDKYTNHTIGATYTGFATNMRLFESTGTGTCLLTDWKANLHEFFELDTEVVTYKSIDECVEKAKWLVNNPTTRKKIALAGQKRTLKDHTLEKRVQYLDQIIRKYIKRSNN
jgi:spore maturation protein CgeB